MAEAELATRAAQAVTGMERLAGRLRSAIGELEGLFPLDPEAFHPDDLDVATGLLLDGFRVRFADLEDLMGRVVFPLAVALAEGAEGLAERPVEECLQDLAGRGLIDAETWHAAREVRNQLAHPEPNAGSQRAAILNRAWRDTGMLLETAERVAAWMRLHLTHHGVGG
ncbi:hypothetical protein [Thiohalorhabdus sp.]|uniref:hypothetical protein n=1 Tax=Thiohalorhabdus sp. TaxID=3094134 RepID=UPI002FC37265